MRPDALEERRDVGGAALNGRQAAKAKDRPAGAPPSIPHALLGLACRAKCFASLPMTCKPNWTSGRGAYWSATG